MNRGWHWRVGSFVATLMVVSMAAFALSLGGATSACAAGLQVPCGYARLEGKVTAADTGEGLGNVLVIVSSTSAALYGESVISAQDGAYSLDIPVALVGVDFAVSASSSTNQAYLSTHEPLPVKVISGTVTTVNLELARGATITGKVESVKLSHPLTQTTVTAFLFDEESEKFTNRASKKVDATGTYTFEGLPSGQYVMHYQPADLDGHMSVYSDGAYSLQDAVPFSVTAPAVVQQNISIGIGARIDGLIRRADDAMPAGGARVYISHVEDRDILLSSFTISARSSDSGQFYLWGVAPGEYLVWAIPDGLFSEPSQRDLLGAYYGDTRQVSAAQVVTVTEANLDSFVNPVSGININLPVGATITGTVRDAATNTPMAGVSVSISQAVNSDLDAVGFAASTDASGVYTATGLEPGMAQVYFDGPAEYLRQTYDGIDFALSSNEGEFIELSLGETVANINAALNKASRLSGRVTDPEGQPIAGVYVRLERVEDLGTWANAFTNSDGQFVGQVAPGNYYVRFSRNIICGCYNLEYYAQGDERAVVTVGASAEVEGINATLTCGAAPPFAEARDALFMPQISRP